MAGLARRSLPLPSGERVGVRGGWAVGGGPLTLPSPHRGEGRCPPPEGHARRAGRAGAGGLPLEPCLLGVREAADDNAVARTLRRFVPIEAVCSRGSPPIPGGAAR